MIKRNKKGQFIKGYTYKQKKETKNKIALSKIGKKRPKWVCNKISKTKKNKLLIGENATNWKGGRCVRKTDGYVFIYSPNHPNATKDKYVLEHRLIIEKKLKRYLTKNEVVHHINHNPSDNRIENLMLLNSLSEHNRLEWGNGRFNKRINVGKNKKRYKKNK